MNIYEKRVSNLLKKHDNVLLTDLFQVRYFTGVDTSSGSVLLTRKKNYLDIWEKHKLGSVMIVCELVDMGKQLKNHKQLAVDKTKLTYSQYKQLKNHKLTDASKTIADMRAIKDKQEIKNIKQACVFAHKAMDHGLEVIKPSMTEKQLRNEIYYSILDQAENISFDAIVHAGDNSLNIHSLPTNKKIKPTDLVIIDIGFKHNGYCSDHTRTVCMKPSKEQKEFYNHVLTAQKLAIKNAKPKVPFKVVHDLVVDYFRENKVNKYFLHKLGHGIGLEVHEKPLPVKDDILRNNSTFTLEPGLYKKGVGGVRIEDTFLLDKKPIQLTKTRKELDNN